MRVILAIFVLAGLTNAARDALSSAPRGADAPQTQRAPEHGRSIARGPFTPRVDARSQGSRRGP